MEVPWCSPFDACQKLSTGRGSFLFESVKGPEKIARYSFVTFAPYAFFSVKDGVVEVEAGGRKAVSSRRRPLGRLREFVEAYPQRPAPGLPPFQGGAAGLFCYEFARYFEKIPGKNPDDLGLPDASFAMTDRLVAFDHFLRRVWIVFCPGARDTGLGYGDVSGLDWAGKYEEAEAAIHLAAERLEAAGHVVGSPTAPEIEIVHDISEEEYTAMVRRAKEYIAAGDIFQANLSLRVRARTGGVHPWRIYSVLRDINPSPFACFMDFGDFHIASSSPERLARLRDGIIDTRPIAGTRPRGKDLAEDRLMRAELLLNEKEKAEHVMLIDLERNDIGRVSDYGSVEVDEFMTTEDYSHVMHIVSNVRGRLARGKTAFDCLRAAFPGGTITGVPKVRCMEIIDELEPFRRGPYTGSAGYIGFGGGMDMNIIIRTFLIKDGYAYVNAGAGIVADSDPLREHRECMRKAEALVRTLEAVKSGRA
jgi:anthranilate/para-aminobenzoate synthase component I